MFSMRCNSRVELSRKSQKINKNPQRIRKIELFLNKYNWKRIDFLPEKDY